MEFNEHTTPENLAKWIYDGIIDGRLQCVPVLRSGRIVSVTVTPVVPKLKEPDPRRTHNSDSRRTKPV